MPSSWKVSPATTSTSPTTWAEGEQTGTIALAIHPIDADRHFGTLTASRELAGDAIRLDSPAGVAVITYGCCTENSAETELSLESLKTLFR